MIIPLPYADRVRPKYSASPLRFLHQTAIDNLWILSA